jgi:flagellar basal body rod protein FlgC
MVSAISTAANAMTTQSERVEAVAQVVASLGATAPAGVTQAAATAPVRVGALPAGGSLEESMATLVEAKAAYRANAAVIETAADMLDTLLDTK